MQDQNFNIGDEVYVYKNILESLKSGNIIKGIIIDEKYSDYGYHGSGDWVLDYVVQGEDGKEYSANHGHGYKSYSIATKKEIIDYVERQIEFLDEHKKEVIKKLESESQELTEYLEVFMNGKSKDKQYKKGSR